jgi:hypothetical protein
MQLQQVTSSNYSTLIANASLPSAVLSELMPQSGTLDWSSDSKIATALAVKTLVEGMVAGLLDYRGGYDASSNTFPATGGSGTGGAILKADTWVISVAGKLGGKDIHVGDFLIANTDTPGQTAANWDTLNTNLTYTPEDVANKVTAITSSSTDTQYGSAKAIWTLVGTKQDTLTSNVLATLLSNFNTCILSDSTKMIGFDSQTEQFTGADLKAYLRTYFDGIYGSGSGDMLLSAVQTVIAEKIFEKDTLSLKGTSTGKTTLSTDNNSATDYVATLPAKSGTIAMTSDIVPVVLPTFIVGEVVTVNGAVGAQTSMLANIPTVDSETVFVNGQAQLRGTDYILAGDTIDWIAYNSESIDLASENITINYMHQ